MTIYFIADTHFNHQNILTFCPNRLKFAQTVNEMNEVMIQNWNRVVYPGDTVFHLGDFAFHSVDDAKNILRQLNGKIHLKAGNHDRKAHLKAYKPYLESVELVGSFVRYNKTDFFLSHYAMDLPLKKFSIHGHSHSREYEELNKINVGVDSALLQHLPLGEPLSQEALWQIVQERKEQIDTFRQLIKQKRSRQ